MATSPDALPSVGVLRELFRSLQPWRSAAIEYGIDCLTGPDGTEYALVDIENLYALRHMLSLRQRQAIEACLVADQREVDVAVAMGVSPTNPVASYATQGMKRLLAIAEEIRAGRDPRELGPEALAPMREVRAVLDHDKVAQDAAADIFAEAIAA